MEKSESRSCQNCRNSFVVDPDDVSFYEKLKVPAPTFCPECRMVRRMLYRNERALYRRDCDRCGKSIITMYAPEKHFTVYCIECHQSDNWDPMSFGRDYDFSKPFFKQFSGLLHSVPRRALYQDFANGSEYSNWAVYLKNSYLIFGGHHYEDCSYAAQCLYVNNCVDVAFLNKCEQCYNSAHLRDCSRVHHSLYSDGCSNSWFLFGCRNCHDCVGCTNLRNSSYCIFNEQYTKEAYEKKLEELKLGSYTAMQRIGAEFAKNSLRYPRKFAWLRNVVGSSGDDLENVKDCRYAFSVFDAERVRYSFYGATGLKDAYDIDHVGLGTEVALEVLSAFGIQRVAFGSRVYYTHDAYYNDDCYNSAYLFGCVGLRKKEYCILNKQYTPEQYHALVREIQRNMDMTPFTGGKGRIYRFGEYFPAEISPFAYNETVAQEYFPITKEEAAIRGYAWREEERRKYNITIPAEKLPDNINDANDGLLNETIGCAHSGTCNEQCTSAFKLTVNELQFYRRMKVPLPRLCPNCRHYGRLRQCNPLKLWSGKCGCAGVASQDGNYRNGAGHFHGAEQCPNEFETPYEAGRPEIVYCERCYNSEVV